MPEDSASDQPTSGAEGTSSLPLIGAVEELNRVNTELKDRVEELGRANSDLHNLISATQIAAVFLDRELRIMRYTPTAVPLFNFVPGDIGRPITNLKLRLDYPELMTDAEAVLRNLGSVERELRDDRTCFLTRVLPYRTLEDQIQGVVLTFVDITERRLAERALRESQEQLRLILENAREYAIVSMDLDRRITSWNSGAEEITGYPREEAMGQPADLIFTPEDRERDVPAAEAGLALTEGHASDERWHQRRDGSRFWGSGVMMAMHDDAGTPIGLLKIFRDHTSALRAKEELEQGHTDLWNALQETERARAETEAALRAKDQFMAMLSHELRTPLTPVLIAAHTLSHNQSLPPSALDALTMIQRNVHLEIQLVDDLLDVTRINRGKMELISAPLDVHEVIERAIEVSTPDIESKNQRLVVELSATDHLLTGTASACSRSSGTCSRMPPSSRPTKAASTFDRATSPDGSSWRCATLAWVSVRKRPTASSRRSSRRIASSRGNLAASAWVSRFRKPLWKRTAASSMPPAPELPKGRLLPWDSHWKFTPSTKPLRKLFERHHVLLLGLALAAIFALAPAAEAPLVTSILERIIERAAVSPQNSPRCPPYSGSLRCRCAIR